MSQPQFIVNPNDVDALIAHIRKGVPQLRVTITGIAAGDVVQVTPSRHEALRMAEEFLDIGATSVLLEPYQAVDVEPSADPPAEESNQEADPPIEPDEPTSD